MKKLFFFSGVAVVLSLLISGICLPAEKSPPLILKHADELQTNLDEENIITNLFGNVWFEHGDLILKSQQAVWYKSAGQVVLTGGVEVQDSTRTLNAQRVVYYQKTGKTVATGSVRLFERKDKVEITGNKGEYDKEKKYAVFTESPKLTVNPEKGDSSLIVTAKKLEYSKNEEIGIATDSVKIRKNRLTATCQKATWYNQENVIILSGSPQARQDQDEVTGDSMQLFLAENRLQRIEVSGRAKASQKLYDSLSARFNESFLTSQKVLFYLQDEKVREVKAINQATSLYLPSSADTLDLTKNETSGDTIQIYIDSSRVERVLVKGGAQGRYFFIPEERKGETLAREDTVYYSAASIDYNVNENLIALTSGSTLKLGNLSLNSARIGYDLKDEILTAEGEKQVIDEETLLVNTPVLNDGQEDIYGQKMIYHLQTRQGKIITGKTKFEKGFYYGKSFYKIGEDEFLAHKGEFTTCDIQEPHYHFSSSKMKLITEDKVIAKPVVLYIADIPIAGLPFYVFPIKPGRHSGFLTFDVGNFTGVNRFIRNLGYYWAVSDYMDLETALDVYEKEGIVIKGLYRYAIWNLLSGQVWGSFKRDSQWEFPSYTQRREYRWDLNFNHSQDISPTLKLAGSGTFLSDNSYYRDFNLNPVERRNRVLRSQLNVSKRWSQAGGNIAFAQEHYLDSDIKTLNLPGLSFNKSTAPLFPPQAKQDKTETRWYNSIYYTFNTNWRNFVNIAADTFADVDSTKKFVTADHSASLSFNPKLFGFLNWQQRVNFRESWYYIFKTNVSQNAAVLTENPARSGSVNFGLGASTNLYGTFPVTAFGLQGLRHTFTPAVSFNYQPRFDKHQDLRRFTGVGPPSSKVQSMAFSAGNAVTVKTKKEKKLNLFTLNFNSGYNFLAAIRKLAPLQTVFRSRAVPNLDLQFDATHDFYDPSGADLNLFNPRLQSFSVTTNFNYQFKSARKADTVAAEGNATPREDLKFSLSHRYSENKQIGNIAKSHWVNFSTDFWATKNWKISYSARYDIFNQEMADQTMEIYRDLHCWEGRITWIPSGFREGFYFRINIKALPEIKLEKGGAGLGTPFY